VPPACGIGWRFGSRRNRPIRDDHGMVRMNSYDEPDVAHRRATLAAQADGVP
jgi:hypothetical protein